MKRACVLLICVFFSLSVVSAQELRWGSDIEISTPGPSTVPQRTLIDQQGNIHTMWDDGDGIFNKDVFYKKMDNTGLTIIPSRRIITSMSSKPQPSIDRNDNIHVIFYSPRIPTDAAYYYGKFTSGGERLVEDTVIFRSQNQYGIEDDYIQEVDKLINQGNVHIVYQQRQDWSWNSDLFYKKLNNNGQGTGPAIQITSAPGTSQLPSMAIDRDGNVYIVWIDLRNGGPEVFYTKLDNNGGTLIDDQPIPSAAGARRDKRLFLAVDVRGDLHLVWDASSDIYYQKFNNNGQSITPPIRVNNEHSLFVGESSSALDEQGNVHIAWIDRSFTPFNEVMYTKLDNSGTTLVDDMRVTNRDGATGSISGLVVDSLIYPHLIRRSTLAGNTRDLYRRAYPRVEVVPRGAACFNSRVEFELYSYPNAQYILALSGGNSPGIPLGDGRIFPLNPDPIFFLSLSGALGLQNHIGTLDAQGRNRATWNVPTVPEARGLVLYAALITINPALPMPRTITSISPAIPVPLPL